MFTFVRGWKYVQDRHQIKIDTIDKSWKIVVRIEPYGSDHQPHIPLSSKRNDQSTL